MKGNTSIAIKNQNSLKGAMNIGKTIEKRLNAIGIYSLADLAEVTPAKAFKMIREENTSVTIPVCYYLYSLEGALQDLHWNDLPEEMKIKLLEEIK